MKNVIGWMQSVCVRVAVIASLVHCSCTYGAVQTNCWIGASGGFWGDATNWSFGHVPESGELAYFNFSGQTMEINVCEDYEIGSLYVERAAKEAPLILKGGGSLTLLANAGKSPYIMQNHPTTLDGVTLNLTTLESLWYSPVTVCGGAVLTNTTGMVRLWGPAATLSVENATVALGGLLGYAASANAIELRGGTIACSRFVCRDGYESKAGVALSIYDGLMSVGGEFSMTDGSSLKMQGGALSVGGMLCIEAGTSLDLLGGAVTNASTLTVSGKRMVTESKGTAFAATAYGTAVDFIEEDGEVIAFSAPFSAPNGQFLVEKRCTLVSHEPFNVMQFLYGANSTASTILTLRLDLLIADDCPLFNSVNGDARDFEVLGPVTLYPSSESMSERLSKTVRPQVDGVLTVDTRNWNDESLRCAIAFPAIGSKNGNGSLDIRGGGAMKLRQCRSYMPFREVSVEDGTTLELGPYENSDYGGLRAEKITLGRGSILKIPVGTNIVSASEWIVDPTARIVLDVYPDLQEGGVLAAVGLAGQLSVDNAQIEVVGSNAGWSAVVTNGVIAIVKPSSVVDGAYPYEWTGNANDLGWSLAENWYCRTVPDGQSALTYYFGASGNQLESDFDIRGAKLAQIIFRDTAINSFVIRESSNERTFAKTASDGGISSSIYSASALPQFCGLKARVIGGSGLSFTSIAAPLVITTSMLYFDKTPNGVLNLGGDIRFSGTPSYPQLCFRGRPVATAQMPSITILPNGELALTNQIETLGRAGSSIRVCKNGTMTFRRGSENARYFWDYMPGKHVVNGRMEIEIPYVGGQDQVYGGNGTLALADVRPSEASSRLIVADELVAEMTRSWTTATADVGGSLSLGVASFSSPTIKLQSDWTYGPGSGVGSSSDAERSLVIDRSSVLTIDAAGHVAEFVDPVIGEGTLSVRNGTLRLPSAVGVSKIRLDVGSVLDVLGDMSLSGIDFAGGVVRYAIGSSISCSHEIDLSSMRIEFGQKLTRRWSTLLTAPRIVGMPILPPMNEARIVPVANGFALQMRAIAGTVVLIR